MNYALLYVYVYGKKKRSRRYPYKVRIGALVVHRRYVAFIWQQDIIDYVDHAILALDIHLHDPGRLILAAVYVRLKMKHSCMNSAFTSEVCGENTYVSRVHGDLG